MQVDDAVVNTQVINIISMNILLLKVQSNRRFCLQSFVPLSP